MKKSKRPVRLWAVCVWILCWQGAAMAMAAAYPAGHLLLASPLSALLRLTELIRTGDFWAAVGTSAVHPHQRQNDERHHRHGNVLTGIAQTDRQLLEMARVFRVPWRRQLWGVWVPAVLPYFRSAVSLAIGLCWKSGVAAEVIGLRTGTVGERLYAAKVYFQTADLFAWTAVIVALSVVMERLVLRGVDALAGKVGIR